MNLNSPRLCKCQPTVSRTLWSTNMWRSRSWFYCVPSFVAISYMRLTQSESLNPKRETSKRHCNHPSRPHVHLSDLTSFSILTIKLNMINSSLGSSKQWLADHELMHVDLNSMVTWIHKVQWTMWKCFNRVNCAFQKYKNCLIRFESIHQELPSVIIVL